MSPRWVFSDKIYVPLHYGIFHICVPNVYQINRKITIFNLKIFFGTFSPKTTKTGNSKISGTEGSILKFYVGNPQGNTIFYKLQIFCIISYTYHCVLLYYTEPSGQKLKLIWSFFFLTLRTSRMRKQFLYR